MLHRVNLHSGESHIRYVYTTLHSFLCRQENCYLVYSVNITSARQKVCSVLTTSIKGVSLFGRTLEGIFQFFYMKG